MKLTSIITLVSGILALTLITLMCLAEVTIEIDPKVEAPAVARAMKKPIEEPQTVVTENGEEVVVLPGNRKPVFPRLYKFFRPRQR